VSNIKEIASEYLKIARQESISFQDDWERNKRWKKKAAELLACIESSGLPIERESYFHHFGIEWHQGKPSLLRGYATRETRP